MENVKVNEMLNGEVAMSFKRKMTLEDKWIELTCFILNEIEWENDIAFCKLEDYKSGAAFNEEDDSKILYGFNEEEIWDKFFEVSGTTDWDDLHSKFKNVRFCVHENLMVFELNNGEKYCALKL